MSRTSEFFRGLAGTLLKSLTKSGSKPRSSPPRTTGRAKPTTQPAGKGGNRGGVSTSLDQRAGAPGQRAGAASQRAGAAGQRAGSVDQRADGAEVGRYGATATVEVKASSVGKVTMTYSPSVDGNPDPGEIVWTWVPFEENDGRGKDRPVLVVAALSSGSVLAVQLTSKAHDGDREFLSLGTGSWDAENRPSWVNLDRVFQVHPQGMRREAASLDKARFDRVKAALKSAYSWS